jgi:CheY-like chemotaxis protein
MRDDFPEKIKEVVAKRVGMICSNPKCRKPTSGPRSDPTKAINIGVAAHITAASSGGPRYDASLAQTNRMSASNAIWLCQNCAKLVDNDAKRYSAALLRSWKQVAEQNALQSIEAISAQETGGKSRVGQKLIVMIDDDQFFLQPTVERLRQNFQVCSFGSADEGLEFVLANAECVSLIILDMMMRMPPGAHNAASADGMFAGMWVLERAKSQIKKHRIPVILLSAALRQAIEPRVRSFNSETHAGLVTFISKPIADKFLIAEVGHNLDLWHK